MPKVKISVPAACIGLGPGSSALGLALGLPQTLELSPRTDTQFVIEHGGEGSGQGAYPASLSHPAMKAAMALFDRTDGAPSGLTLTVSATIPVEVGLGDTTALIVGGLMGANNLIKVPLKRDQVAELASELSGQSAAAVTSLFGGLTVSVGAGKSLLYRRLDIASQKVVLVVPDVAGYRDKVASFVPLPASAEQSALALGHLGLLIEAFRKNETALIGRILQAGYAENARTVLIPGYAAALEAARSAGAFAVTLCGDGTAFIAFATKEHRQIEQDIVKALNGAGTQARTWIVNVDTQGVALSVSG